MGIIISICVIIVIVLTFHFGAPLIVVAVINRKFRNRKGYSAEIDRVQVRLIRGQLMICDLHVHTAADSLPSDQTMLSFHLPLIIIRFSWKALLRKSFRASIIARNASLEVNHHPDSQTSLEELYTALHLNLKKAAPFCVDLSVEDGRLDYRLPGDSNSIRLTTVNCLANNLTNEFTLSHQTRFNLSEKIFEGSLDLWGNLDLSADKPTFAAHAKLSQAGFSPFQSIAA